MNLSLKNINKKFDNTMVLKDISLDLQDKKSIVIIGPSGGGKSTLLNILAGYIELDSGVAAINEHYLKNNEKFLREYRKKVGIVFQAYNLFPHLTALRNITLILEKVHSYSKKDANDKAVRLLKQFQLEDHKDKKPIQLSGGQQQRLAIVRALSYDPEILFFDEPSAALDPALTSEVLEVIKELKDKNRDMIIVTHEMGFARQVADYILFIDNGRITESGYPDEIFNNPKTEELKRFLDKILEWKL